MILICNACEKRFVVPDKAISVAGRTVQCGSCGNKWKQYPVKSDLSQKITAKEDSAKKISNLPKKQKPKKPKIKKTREINLYSPEYLAKKHGISLKNLDSNVDDKKFNKNVSFGFYNSLILMIFIIIVLSRGLYFFQDLIVQKFPFTENYINYFFETIKSIFEIYKNLISSY